MSIPFALAQRPPARRRTTRARMRPVLIAFLALAALSFLTAPSARAQSCAIWSPIFPAAEPSPRVNTAMAYDSLRDRLVLFSGDSNGTLQTSTWEFNGANWSFSNPSPSPSPRQGHSMVFDESRARIVMFSGLSATQFENATWEWSGTAWTIRASGGPAPRFHHKMVYDSDRARVILFGGSNASVFLGDTWEWDGAAGVWTNVTPVGPSPSPRSVHAMAYDSVRRKVVLFGGFGDQGFNYDTWEWDPATSQWTQIDAAGPPSWASVVMSFDPASARCVLVRGFTDPMYHNEVWEWNGVAWTRTFIPTDHRAYPVLAHDSTRGRMLLFAGLGGDSTGIFFHVNSTASLDRAPWRLAYSLGPLPRNGHAMAAHPAAGNVVLFGGFATDGLDSFYVADTALWDGVEWLGAMAIGPTARTGHAMAEENAGATVLLFGGGVSAPYLNDTWRWDGAAWTQLAPANSPSPRIDHSMAYDAARDRVVLFGGFALGQSGYAPTDETWEWDGADWTQRFPAHTPIARLGHAMSYDPRRGRVILSCGAAGEDADFEISDIWEWDGDDWIDVTPVDGPTPRVGAAIGHDGARAVSLLFGGWSALTFRDTWEWNSPDWRLIKPVGPPARADHAIATDPIRGSAVMFGGVDLDSGILRGDTWVTRSAAPAVLARITDQSAAPGDTVVFQAQGAGTGQLSYHWLRDGVFFGDDGTHIFGTTSRTLVLSPVELADAAEYSVAVQGACGIAISNDATLTVSAPCPSDVSADGQVGAADLAFILGAWGTGPGPLDLDMNGDIGAGDLAFILGAWGPCP